MEDKKSNVNSSYTEHITTTWHVLIVCFVLHIFYVAFYSEGWNLQTDSIHAILFTIGWFFFLSEGIMIISPDNVLTKNFSHNLKLKLHSLMVVITIGCCVSGYLVIYLGEQTYDKTIHSSIGKISLIIFALALISGMCTLFISHVEWCYSLNVQKIIHVVFGIATSTIGTISLYFALETDWYKMRVGDNTDIFSKIIIIVALLWGIVKPLVNFCKKVT